MKPSILVFAPYYAPGFRAGGPIVSVGNIVEHLSSDFDFKVVTRDRDLNDAVPYPNLGPGAWRDVGKANVYYLAPNQMRLRFMAKLLRDTPHDVLYLNSFFDPFFASLPLLARRLGIAPRCPAVLAPRGEFSPGALALKARKKRLFIAASKIIHLHTGMTWHASTDREASEIRDVMGGAAQQLGIAVNLPRLSSRKLKHTKSRRPGEPLQVAFLSRISPKKNLLFAIEVLAQVRVPVMFSIYGPKEDLAYWRRCDAAINNLPAHVTAVHCGVLRPEQVTDTLSEHDLFFLPTLGENYGHAIADAFQAGLPVLTSDQTPWRNLLEEGVGADLPLVDKEAFRRFIECTATMLPEAVKATHAQVTDYANRIGSATAAAVDANRNLFLSALLSNKLVASQTN